MKLKKAASVIRSLSILPIGLLIILCVNIKTANAQFNQHTLEQSKKPMDYSILLAGHLYGNKSESIYPAASIVANIDLLNELKPKFFVMLGDIVERSDEVEFSAFKRKFTGKLNFPVFNAPGNHDLINRKLYTSEFGETYFSFEHGSEYFIFLDSELDNAEISGPQLDFVLESIEYVGTKDAIKNLFIFSHRLIWAINNPAFDKILNHANGPRKAFHPKTAKSFSTQILPKLSLMNEKKVYIVSGDVGANYAINLLYENLNGGNITYIATGIGDGPNDMILQAIIKDAGNIVEFIPISLTNRKMAPINQYGIEYWKKYFND